MTRFVGLQFQSKYGKPLQASREGKCSSKEAEAGVLAMEALHKQVQLSRFLLFKAHLLVLLPVDFVVDTGECVLLLQAQVGTS
jgi:TATA-binding protein-associated factor